MNNRPSSITAIGWILIGYGIFGLIIGIAGILLVKAAEGSETFAEFIPESAQHNYVFSLIGAFVYITCGQRILKGENWAHIVWTVWTIASFFYGVILSGLSENSLVASTAWASMFTGLLVMGALIYFLYRPEASRFFSGEVEMASSPPAAPANVRHSPDEN